MLRELVVVCLAASAMASLLPEPGQLALQLDEDQFEDYLDMWLAVEEPKWLNTSAITKSGGTGCTIRVNGDLGQPQPTYTRNGDYMQPTGNSGLIHLNSGDDVKIGCPGSGRTIQHENIASTVKFAVGFDVDGVFYPKYHSCFDEQRLEVLYTTYEQNPTNAVHQINVSRPSWLVGSWYPGVATNTMYTQVQQKITIAGYVGEELAEKYITSTQFLSRGHLVAKTDMIYATGQRATFYFINAAPQWQPFNAGNWNWLEQNLRARIGLAGYHTTIYTGTFGLSQLRNQDNQLVDIYLYTDANNNPQLPVPLYYYKVVYDKETRRGTAFVSVNNPYYTEEELKSLTFCTDLCRNNDNFSWLKWQPDRIEIGYSFCCAVDDFRSTVPHLPPFEVTGLLY